MDTYISDFKLPKEFSKKKKMMLSVGMVIPNTSKAVEWSVNNDLERVYLTIEDSVIAALTEKLKSGMSVKELEKCAVGVLSREYPVHIFNDAPCAITPQGDPIDAEFDAKTLSFNATLHGREYEDSHLDILGIDSIIVDDGGNITKFKAHPLINSALA